jgi:predicted SprT family Zn-dependent metalloprotease
MNLTDCSRLARSLMTEHGLTDWRLEYGSAHKLFGVCCFGPKIIRLSERLVGLNPESICRDIILHEIAHALAGYDAKHGPDWKRIAKRIGCSSDRCYGEEVVKPVAPAPYEAVCPGCGKRYQRYRRPKVGVNHSCSVCSGGRFNSKFLLVWRKPVLTGRS